MRWRAVVLLLVSACSQWPGGPDASTQSDPVTAYCDARAAAHCAWQRRCGVASEFGCAVLKPDCAAVERPLLRAGALRFDADAGADCAAAIAAEQCEFFPFRHTPTRCDEVFVGLKAEGEQCGVCAPDLACIITAINTCGRCGPRPAEAALPGLGERCTSPAVDGAGCARGLGCSGFDGGYLVCEPYAGAGEDCGRKICALGLSCRASDGGSTCEPLSDVGETCSQRLDCKSGLRCVTGSCAPQLGQGESCATWEDCASLRCEAGSCAAQYVGLGDSCASVACSPGLRCSADRVCVWPLPPGASCSDDICESGASCEQGVCVNRVLSCQ